jgi:hypothetical protein
MKLGFGSLSFDALLDQAVHLRAAGVEIAMELHGNQCVYTATSAFTTSLRF